jgi:hypothetical protein
MPKVTVGLKASLVEDVVTRATSGIGPILLEQMASCVRADVTGKYSGDVMAVGMLLEVIRWGQPVRGPRLAAMTEMSKTAATISADRTGFAYNEKVIYISARSPIAERHFIRQMPRIDQEGQVAAVKINGNEATIEFKKVTFKERESSCSETSKIIMWSGGTPIYERNCKYTGNVVTRDITAPAFTTYKHFLAGIKPGVVVKYQEGTPGEGFPVEVWSKDGKTLLAVMGMPAQ